METKMIRVPFEVELAKKITNGETEGRIVTRHGLSVRIICWDIKDEKFPLGAVVCNNHKEAFISYTIQGEYYSNKTVEHNYDLMLEIPEYMTFKDGDILTYWPNGNRWCIFIYKNHDKDILYNYVTYDCDSRENNILTFGSSFYTTCLCHPSTEKEKQSLIDALKNSRDPRAKSCLKKLGIELDTKSEFKPFDKVLVRDFDEKIWYADIFSHLDKNGSYICVGSIWDDCIPYNEETEYLLGTTEDI